MTAAELRASLLQEAVSGRLVPQRPEDGTAEALYEEIQKEKARLVAEKKIKKEKPLPPVTDEEKPFDIPRREALRHSRHMEMGAAGSHIQFTSREKYHFCTNCNNSG